MSRPVTSGGIRYYSARATSIPQRTLRLYSGELSLGIFRLSSEPSPSMYSSSALGGDGTTRLGAGGDTTGGGVAAPALAVTGLVGGAAFAGAGAGASAMAVLGIALGAV